MPYGVSDSLWALLPEDDKAMIQAQYEAANAPPPVPESGGDGGVGSPPPGPGATQQQYQDYVNTLFAQYGNQTGAEYGQYGGDLAYLNDLTAGGGIIAPINQDFGGGGGGGFNTAVFSEADINISGAPEWWRAMIPDSNNPLSNFQTLSNILIPLLSPEDQRTVATNLFQSDPEQFALYDPELLDPAQIPGEITPELRRQFFTGERANDALGALDQLLAASGKTAEDFGPGYNYLRSIADTIGGFGLTSGANQLTETQQGQLLAQLDPLLAQGQSDALGAFGPLSRSFANPFFSAGALTGTTKNQFGDVIRPGNPRYY
jgi:hypothetical protein